MFKRLFLKVVSVAIRLVVVLVLVLFASPVIPARADSSVCGPITVDTTWNLAGSPYIVTCDVQVLAGVTLTIENGVMVKFNNSTGLRIDGELIATGVTFTSSSLTPSRGIWKNIYFTAGSANAVFDGSGNYLSGSKLQNSVVTWGGGSAGTLGAVEVAGASPYLDHNTISNSSTRGLYAAGESTSEKIRISGNTVNSNGGGGIYVSSGVLEGNSVYGNTGNKDGGGVYALNSVLNGNQINDNDGRFGGGVYASGCNLDNNTVSGNSGDEYGGGVYAEGGALTDNLITGNSIVCGLSGHARGAGIFATGGSILGNTVSGNAPVSSAAHTYGGGIYAVLSTVSENIVSNNAASGSGVGYGGGIYGSGSAISLNTITGNTTAAGVSYTSYGGGVFADGGSVTGNTISSNSAAGGGESLGGGVYGTVATVTGNTLSGNSGNKGGAIYANKGTVTNNVVQNNTTSLNGTVYVFQGTALGNTIQGNTATNGGGMYGDGATLTGNTLEDNTAVLGAGIYATASTVLGNTLTGNDAYSNGGGIYASGGTVTGNTLTGNTVPSYGHGSGAYIIGVTSFTYNNVLDNTGGGTAGGVSVSGQPVLHYNNLYDNVPYDMEVVSELPVDATLNYWGETLCTQIPNQIYDGYDLPGIGNITYAPSLYSPVPVAQLEYPTGLDFTIEGSQVTLSWNPIANLPIYGCRVPGSDEPDIQYLVFYGDEACAPYDGDWLLSDSPIDAGDSTTLTLSGLPATTTYVTVAAYDYLTRQSAFSNVIEITGTGDGYTIFLPLLTK